MLLRRYLEDRPILRIRPVHPEVYQWFFELPSGEHEGRPTTKYGFLLYFDVINRGRRPVDLESWNLWIRNTAGQWTELKPISIPEPTVPLGAAGEKVWPVLGVAGSRTPGSTLARPGEAVGGFAYYVLEYFEDSTAGLRIVGNRVSAILKVRSILGNRVQQTFSLERVSLARVQQFVPGIEAIDSMVSVKDSDSLVGDHPQPPSCD